MECTTGVRTAPMGAGWKWAPLADSASSHHIPSLAPAVALPAPRHDRRRTGAAGSPPGGFPFGGTPSRGCEIWELRWAAPRSAAALYRTAPQHDAGAQISAHYPRKRESTIFVSRASEARPWDPPAPILGPRLSLSPRKQGRGPAETIDGPSLDSGNSLCYRTQPSRPAVGAIPGA